jgi:catalase
LLDRAGIPAQLPSGDDDPGLLAGTWGEAVVGADAFIAAIGNHRHPVRDRDPPLI